MAKRYTDSGKWDDPFFCELDMKYKMMWIYILDKCNHAGIFKWSKRLAEFNVGEPFTADEILAAFGDRLIPIRHDKWYIPKFIEFQYGELSETNRVHQSVIKILEKEGVFKGRLRVVVDPKDKDKDKDNINIKNKGVTKSDQLKTIQESFAKLKSDFPNRNVESEFEHFKDYCDAKGKSYKNYLAAFRNWLRNEQFRKPEDDKPKPQSIIIACPNGHVKRKSKKGVRSVCPECYEQLKPQDQIQLERAIA